MKHLTKFLALAITIMAFGILFSACSGTKINQADLNGTWILKSINGVPVTDAFKGNKPNIEFDFEKNMVYGYAGCNRFSGPFTLEKNLFKAGKLTSTLMLCMEDNKEDEFLGTLSLENGLELSIENQILFFKNGDKVAFEFQLGEKLAD